MEDYDISMLIAGVVHSSNARKQNVGQALSMHMGFMPGPGGRDGSVDGAIMTGANLIATFQSKLSANLLPLDEAKILHSDLIRLKPLVTVYVAGVGYENSFSRLLNGQRASYRATVYLLTLEDVFKKSSAYCLAMANLPQHDGGAINWSSFMV